MTEKGDLHSETFGPVPGAARVESLVLLAMYPIEGNQG